MAGTFRWPFGMSLAVLGALLFAGSFLPVSASGAASATPTVKVTQDAKLGNIVSTTASHAATSGASSKSW